jgi:hypothetical protein
MDRPTPCHQLPLPRVVATASIFGTPLENESLTSWLRTQDAMPTVSPPRPCNHRRSRPPQLSSIFTRFNYLSNERQPSRCSLPVSSSQVITHNNTTHQPQHRHHQLSQLLRNWFQPRHFHRSSSTSDGDSAPTVASFRVLLQSASFR